MLNSCIHDVRLQRRGFGQPLAPSNPLLRITSTASCGALDCDLGGGFDDCVSPGGGRVSPGGRGSPRTGRVGRHLMSTNKIINMEFDVAPTLWCSSRDEEIDSPPPQDVNGSSYTPVSRGKRSKADVVHEQAHIIQTLQHELKELKSRMDDMEEVQTAAQHDAGDDDDDGEGRTRPIDRLYEKADESYYFRVQTMILYNAVTPRLVLHFLNVIFCILLQICALQTVWQCIWIPASSENYVADDEVDAYFPAGKPYPTNYANIFHWYDHTQIDGVQNITVIPLFFCVIMITLTTRNDMNECKAGYVLVQSEVRYVIADETKRVKGRGSIVDTIGVQSQTLRLVAVTFLHLLRGSLVWCVLRRGSRAPEKWRSFSRYFYDVSAQILGTSDGPFNLLLNSLAMVFVLELDNVIYFDMPMKNFFGVEDPYLKKRYLRRLKVARQIFRDAYHTCQTAPKSVARLYHTVGWVYIWGTAVALFLMGFHQQKYTTTGKFVTVDDDSGAGPVHPQLTKMYNWCMYVLLFFILIDIQTVAFVASWDRPRSKLKWALQALGNFAFEGCCLIVMRHLIIRYVLGILLAYGYSHKTWPVRFWDRVNPGPNRPDNEYEYGDYYGADYGADYYGAAYEDGADYGATTYE